MQSVHFIETHIKEDLTVKQIASDVGYSVFHFCRIFTINQGVPPGDFIRKKKLLSARFELLKSDKIIDIAIDYGFDTASGFSKAFHKEFGYSPTTYKKRISSDSTNEIITNIGGLIMNPVLIKKSAFKVAGYGIKTNVAENFTKDIAAYWDTYNGENLECKMYSQLNPPKHGEVGVCIPNGDDENAIYLFGVIVDNYQKVTADMMTVTVPEAEYAVFTTPPVNTANTAQTYDSDPLSIVVKETWKYIFNEWFPKSDYEFDDTKVDFEFYDERCHGLENSVMDIYVPIIKRHN